MSERIIQLSSQGLERAASTSPSNFAFIVNDVEIPCTEFEASFISPRVHWLLQQDRTTNSFFVEIGRDGIELKRVIDVFVELMKGSEVVASATEMVGLHEFAGAVGNIELLNQLDDNETINENNVYSRMKKGQLCGCCIEDEIGFAGSHFSELDLDELAKLDICIVERIVSCPELRLSDEDSLLEFICRIDCDSPILVRYVLSEYLSSEKMSLFQNFVFGSHPDPVIWSSLCRRLVVPLPQPATIPMKEDKSLDGIISYLTTKHGGNVHDKGIVRMTSKSVHMDMPEKNRPQNAANLSSEPGFYSQDYPGEWLCWDFGEMRVGLTHYTIRTQYLKSWVVGGSLDGRSWKEIDRQTDNRDFNYHGFSGTASFVIADPAEFRFIRLTQTGRNHAGDDELLLRAVEFFGTLSE
jgi:hypothetical protein